MQNPKGLWIAVGGGSLADAISHSIERRGQFTTTVVTSDVRPRAAELVVVSLHGTSADFVGISQAGRRIATGQMTLVITRIVAIKQMSSDDLRQQLPRRFANQFHPPVVGEYRPTPRLWQEVLRVLAAQDPASGNRIRDLGRVVSDARSPIERPEGALDVFERDAIASALQAWQGRPFRTRLMRSVVPSEAAPVASFLSQIEGIPVWEDVQITHDQTTFPGMEVARRDQIGSVVLRDRGEYLTILNCNRQPLEKTLGVDLIYYSHRFDSFVLVQYKRMTAGASGTVYRPYGDRSHGAELRRMIEADKMLRALPKIFNRNIDSFRLSGRPFYVKICEPRIKTALDSGMVSGMYIPLGLWRRLLKSGSVRGPHGGVRITWDNCTRRLNNDEFTTLLRQGWIGSAAGHSARLAEIIDEVLGSGRMLVLAATSAAPLSKGFRRDVFGRFAAEDDPEGAI